MCNRINWTKITDCPVDSRKKLITYIDQLIELKHDSEKDGIRSLERYINTSSDLYEKTALNFIVQGYMPEMCRTMLYNLISSSEIDSLTYLKYVIFTEFVLMLQKGETSDQAIKMMLLSYLGIECADVFWR